MVCPMHESAELIPLVHAAKLDPVPQSKRDALRQIDIVRNQQGLAILQTQDESLVTGSIVVIR